MTPLRAMDLRKLSAARRTDLHQVRVRRRFRNAGSPGEGRGSRSPEALS